MRIKGGLGNQLFQYAAAYALSKRLEQPFQFNPSFTENMTVRGYKLPELNCDVTTVVADNELPKSVKHIKNLYVNKMLRILNLPKHKCGNNLYWIETKDEWQPDFYTIKAENLFVDGYFQSEEYFKEYRVDLLRQFVPVYEPEKQYIETLEKIKDCNSVAVHVRRSDFKRDRNPFHYILDEKYYHDAVKYMRNKIDSPVFFWFSDDMDWVKDNIGTNTDYRFVSIQTKHSDIDDMMLMKNCKHIIAANSTFSWWAAWLNENENAIKVVPERPYGMEGMIPTDWKKIDIY